MIPFSWAWGDPALVVDRIISLRERLAAADKEMQIRERRIKARRIRKLTKQAQGRLLKGQNNG